MNNFHSWLCLFSIMTCFVAVTVGRAVIVGGSKADAHHEFRYHVSLQNDDHVHGCGGGIIGDRFILTAAHCVVLDGHIDTMPISILAGTNDLHVKGKTTQRIRVKKIFVPREYNEHKVFTTGDIAVLMLEHSLELAKHPNLKKLKLAHDKQETNAGQKAEFAGYGWEWIDVLDGEIGGSNDTRLQFAEMDVLHHCPSRPISSKQLCARTRQQAKAKTRGVCFGDSGGPLVQAGTVIGVLSIALEDCNEKDIGALYTRVSHFHDFIQHSMANKNHKDMRTLQLIP